MKELFGAFLGALGFGFLYNLSGYSLWLAAVNAVIGQMVYLTMIRLSAAEFTAMGCASFIVVIVGISLIRCLKISRTSFLSCALIPLVPGKGIYNAISGWITNDAAAGDWIRLTILQALGIAIGCLLAQGTVQLISKGIRCFRNSAKKTR